MHACKTKTEKAVINKTDTVGVAQVCQPNFNTQKCG